MRILELKLYTSELEKQRAFFLETMGFELLEEDSDAFSVKVGWSKLQFVRSTMPHSYHYCFLIPANQLHGALEWVDQRTETVETEPGEKIVHFESWNAESFYFFDGAGNIAECIVRHDLKNASATPFGVSSLLCVNEIGMGTDDVEGLNQQLTNEIGTPFYKGDLQRFGTNGSEEGIFLIPNYNLKEIWFPTELKIKPEPFEAIVQESGQTFSVLYRDGKLTTRKLS